MAVNPSLHLWRSVLIHGLHDAAQAQTPQDAAWIGSPDFVQVCILAEVNPEAVLRAYTVERFAGRRKVA
ncbi:MAG: hypothetical protein R6V26_03425 [Roseovarius sp.]